MCVKREYTDEFEVGSWISPWFFFHPAIRDVPHWTGKAKHSYWSIKALASQVQKRGRSSSPWLFSLSFLKSWLPPPQPMWWKRLLGPMPGRPRWTGLEGVVHSLPAHSRTLVLAWPRPPGRFRSSTAEAVGWGWQSSVTNAILHDFERKMWRWGGWEVRLSDHKITKKAHKYKTYCPI